MKRSIHLLLLLTLGLAGCSPSNSGSSASRPSTAETPPAVEQGFTRLTLKDFEPFRGDEHTWVEKEGEIVCSGTPKSYMHSREKYGNFTWRGDYRFAPDAEVSQDPPKYPNTGFMLHIIEPHQIWPRSLEVQGRFDEMAQIKANGGIPPLMIEDHHDARESARKPVGEWNSIEIISKDGEVTAFLNGQLICHSSAGELTEGLIGLQSELYEVHFRNLRIRRE